MTVKRRNEGWLRSMAQDGGLKKTRHETRSNGLVGSCKWELGEYFSPPTLGTWVLAEGAASSREREPSNKNSGSVK